VKERDDVHNLRFDLIQQAIPEDESLAGIGLAEFGDDAAALTQRCQRFGGRKCLLEHAKCAGN
jgi:hypothetical protein